MNSGSTLSTGESISQTQSFKSFLINLMQIEMAFFLMKISRIQLGLCAIRLKDFILDRIGNKLRRLLLVNMIDVGQQLQCTPIFAIYI